MKLFYHEVFKILQIPLVWLYLLACFCLNCVELETYFVDIGFLDYTNSVAKEIGWELGEEFDLALEKMPDHPYKESLQEATHGMGYYYATMDIPQLGQIMIDFSPTKEENSPFFRNLLAKKFDTLGNQVKKIASPSLLAGTQSQMMFDILFYALFPNIILQIALLTAIIMMFLTDYEEMNQTHLLVYSTKKGREVQKIKFFSGCLLSLGSYFLLSLLTFSAFFLKFPLFGVLFATMDSPFLSITVGVFDFPFLTWTSMTFLGYFFAVFFFSGVILLICAMASWCVAVLCQNMYFSFGVSALFVLLQWKLFLFCFYQAVPLGIYSMGGNPVVLSQKIHLWFSYMGYLSLFPMEETFGLLLSLTLAFLLWGKVYQCFKRKDLCT